MFNTEGRTILVDDNIVEAAMSSSIGDASTRTDQNAQEAQSMWEQLVDEMRGFTAEQPFVAVLSALGLGAVVGLLTTRR